MEVMNRNFKQLEEQLNGFSGGYFSFTTSVNDQEFALYNKPTNGVLYIEQEKTKKFVHTGQNHSSSLIVWGCGEFGQHGLNQRGDVSCAVALSKVKSGEFVLSNDDFPVGTVCGSSHTLVLTGKGQVYSWGNGTSGQLGNGTTTTTVKPTLVPLALDSKIQGMSCGARHSFFWTNNGHCYSFGNNFNAQLGYNFSKADFKENQLEPVLVELFPDMKVKEVASGARHSLFLLTTGQVMAVGCNQHGQIGNDTTEDVVIPTMLDDLNSITHVAYGNIHSLASDENGSVYAWGYGKAFGNKARHVVTPQKFTPDVTERSAVISLAGGDSHSMVLFGNGVLFTWGNNYEGQLGVGQDIIYRNQPEAIPCDLLPRPVTQIACGETTSAAVTGKGQLFMWGKNAGLIHSDKPSQYFQYLPHHIEMEGLSITEISCGAWHFSAIIKNSKSEMENIFQNIESSEAEQPALIEQELILAEVVLPCKDGDNMASTETTAQRKKNSENETLDENEDGSSLDACFITKHGSYSQVSRVENGSYENETLSSDRVKEKQQTKYVKDDSLKQADFLDKEVSFEKEENNCLATNTDTLNLCKTEFYGEEKTGCETNEDTNVVDSFRTYHCEERCEDSRLSTKHENGIQTKKDENNPYNRSQMETRFVCDFQEVKPTVELFQKQPTLAFETEDSMILGDNKLSTRQNNLLPNEKTTDFCTPKSESVSRENFNPEDEIILEKNRTKNQDSLPNYCEDFRNYVGFKDDHFLGEERNESSPKYFEDVGDKNLLKEDAFLDNDNVEEGNIESTKTPRNEREIVRKPSSSNRVKQWNHFQSFHGYYEKNSTSLPDKRTSLLKKKNISGDITGLSFDSQCGSLKQNSELLNHGFRFPVAPAQNRTIDASQIFPRRQTVPVIDLSFGKSLGNGYRPAGQDRVKPSFTTFRNVWKASTLFREKQRQRMLDQGRESDKNLVLNLENMLPNRPTHAVREIEKWTKLKEEPPQELTGNSKLNCCHHKGGVLPPICSCKRKGVVLGQHDASSSLTNVFIDRR